MAINRVSKANARDLNRKVTKGSQYGYCQTAAATAAKVVTRENFDHLYAGAHIFVLFADTNSADAPTLNVSGTGAKPIYYGTAAAGASNKWDAGDTVEFIYDGTNWRGFPSPNISTGGFTPELHQVTTDLTCTIGSRIGRYYRIGHLCFIDIQLYNVNVTAAGTGETYISGLPFAADGTVSKYYLPEGACFNLFSDTAMRPVIESGASRIKLNDKLGNAKIPSVTSGSFLFLSGVYRI